MTVNAATASNISYTSANRGAVNFKNGDFYNACSAVTGRALNYVNFTSLPSSQGTLYYNYNTSSGNYDSKVTTSANYYYNSASYLAYVTFVPASGYSGTVTIPYKGYDSSGISYTGNVVITVGAGGDVTYTTAKNTALTLGNSAFETFSKDQTGLTFDGIKFTSLPAASKGKLYYDYTSSGDYDSSVGAGYYYRSSTPRLDRITFVPADDYSGTVTIPFTGLNTSNTTFSGNLVITVGKSESTITYSASENSSVDFSVGDFQDYCRDETDSNLDYVTFSTPSSSKGTLYYDYSSSSSTGAKVSDSTKYYRNSSPYLDDVTFVPAKNYTGTVTFSFSARSVGGTTANGTVKVYVGTAEGDVSYSVAAGGAVTFKADDFNACSKDETGYNLDYVRFSIPAASKGVLYSAYKTSSGTGTKVTDSTSYYRSSSPSLSDVTFVPASGFTGSVSIDFTGRTTNGTSFNGSVGIQVSANAKADVVRYTSAGAPVLFQVSDFSRACDARGGGTLSQVVFTLPNSSYGALYYNYKNATSFEGLVASGTAYLRTGSPSLSNVTFVPKAGYTGTATLSYTGTDSVGQTYTGSVEISVSAPAVSSSKYFGDMGAYDWASDAVDYLYENNVVTGTSATTFGPSAQITRGDFVLMLYRGFKLSGAAGENFPDVPADKYYAQAIAVAKALGIAKGTDNKFNPTGQLTRQDAMLLIQRAMQVSGKSMSDGAASLLSSYADGAAVADYAQGAVAALVRDGIIQGDNSRRLNPKSSITRAEMAVILYRVLTK